MLTHLKISNYALADAVDIHWPSGMTAVTGETGAGKSILLKALGLALGERADRDAVRSGAPRAEVEAAFDLERQPEAALWLQQQELDDNDTLVLRRTLSADGRSKAYINGRQVGLGVLRELGERLVDIQGQHAHHALTRRTEQLRRLDDFGGHQPLCTQVAGHARALESVRRELERAEASREQLNDRRNLLQYQLEELELLAIGATEWQALETEQRALAQAETTLQTGQQALDALAGDSGIEPTLAQLRTWLSELATHEPSLKDAAELVDSAAIQLAEAGSDLRRTLSDVQIDDVRLAEVDARIAQVLALARKHRVDPSELHSLTSTLQLELAGADAEETAIDQLREAHARHAAEYAKAAQALSAARGAAADRLASAITTKLTALGLDACRFEVRLLAVPADQTPADGQERVEFWVSTNPDQPTLPLGKVASGGELARISLAIQVATAETSSIPTLLFDEVDVGVSGRVADVVGQLLRGLAAHTQIICITHQPQVAALGHHHLLVEKPPVETGGSTRTRIRHLSPKQREHELARMLAGAEVTPQATAHAAALLQSGGA